MTEAAVVLRVCTSCPWSGIDRLRDAVAAEHFAVPVRVEPQDCMNGCRNPVTLALQGKGRATCFFAGIDPEADRDDILATLRAYIAAPQGWIEDARPCGRLRLCLVGRVPAL